MAWNSAKANDAFVNCVGCTMPHGWCCKGNAENPAKKLRVRRILTPNWMVWQVQDEGCGLPQQSRTATLPPALDCSSGRGLFLIHQCFDDVRWSRRGNRLQLACRRPVSDADSPDPSALL